MRLAGIGCVLLTAALAAGCGGKSADSSAAAATAAAPKATATPKPSPTSSPAPKLQSASDLRACAVLEQAITAVSELIGHTTENMTQALHPKQLAKLTGTAQHSLIDSANLIAIISAPDPLVDSQHEIEKGLRMFAADFGRAKVSTAKGDMAKASAQMVDKTALRKIQESAKYIDDACGA